MRKTNDIKGLFEGGSERLTSLKDRSRARCEVLAQVLAVLPPHLAATVVSAGIETGRLTIGVASAAWATRLRYVTDTLRKRVGQSLGAQITSVRIKVVQPPRE